MVGGLVTALVWKILLDGGFLGPMLGELDPILPALGVNAFALVVLELTRKDSGSAS
jgi:hypothetical protein